MSITAKGHYEVLNKRRQHLIIATTILLTISVVLLVIDAFTPLPKDIWLPFLLPGMLTYCYLWGLSDTDKAIWKSQADVNKEERRRNNERTRCNPHI